MSCKSVDQHRLRSKVALPKPLLSGHSLESETSLTITSTLPGLASASTPLLVSNAGQSAYNSFTNRSTMASLSSVLESSTSPPALPAFPLPSSPLAIQQQQQQRLPILPSVQSSSSTEHSSAPSTRSSTLSTVPSSSGSSPSSDPSKETVGASSAVPSVVASSPASPSPSTHSLSSAAKTIRKADLFSQLQASKLLEASRVPTSSALSRTQSQPRSSHGHGLQSSDNLLKGVEMRRGSSVSGSSTAPLALGPVSDLSEDTSSATSYQTFPSVPAAKAQPKQPKYLRSHYLRPSTAPSALNSPSTVSLTIPPSASSTRPNLNASSTSSILIDNDHRHPSPSHSTLSLASYNARYSHDLPSSSSTQLDSSHSRPPTTSATSKKSSSGVFSVFKNKKASSKSRPSSSSSNKSNISSSYHPPALVPDGSPSSLDSSDDDHEPNLLPQPVLCPLTAQSTVSLAPSSRSRHHQASTSSLTVHAHPSTSNFTPNFTPSVSSYHYLRRPSATSLAPNAPSNTDSILPQAWDLSEELAIVERSDRRKKQTGAAGEKIPLGSVKSSASGRKKETKRERKERLRLEDEAFMVDPDRRPSAKEMFEASLLEVIDGDGVSFCSPSIYRLATEQRS
jgi:hypothetical protein